MTVVRCDICRSYYREPEGHPCSGLRTADWLRFERSLRSWMATDPYARFEAYYARRRR